MERREPLRADPERTREWQRRSAEKAETRRRERARVAQPGERACPGCGASFTPRPSRGTLSGWTAYCSRSCAGRVARPRQGEVRVCAREGCGVEFYAPPSRKQRFCSRRCGQLAKAKPSSESRRRQGEAQRRNGSKRGERNPRHKHGQRAGIKGGPRFKSGMAACAHCRDRRRRPHEHHVIYAQHVTRAGGDVTDPDNALRLCPGCHPRHHSRAEPVLLSELRDENYRFARALLGAAAYDYLRRRYTGHDLRLFDVAEPAPDTTRAAMALDDMLEAGGRPREAMVRLLREWT